MHLLNDPYSKETQKTNCLVYRILCDCQPCSAAGKFNQGSMESRAEISLHSQRKLNNNLAEIKEQKLQNQQQNLGSAGPPLTTWIEPIAMINQATQDYFAGPEYNYMDFQAPSTESNLPKGSKPGRNTGKVYFPDA